MNPRDHANAYVGFSTGSATAFLLYELHKRCGISLDAQETSFLSVSVAAAFLFAGRLLGGRKKN